MAEHTGTFRWEMMGKPDYSVAASYVASLPKEVKNGLNQTEERTLTRLFFLIWLGAAHSGRGTGYCIPSQGYLGEAIARSRYSISRALRTLCDMGLVDRSRRAPVQGKYQTCIYKAGRRLLATLYARFSNRRSLGNHVAETPHNNLKKGNISGGADRGAPPTLQTGVHAPSLSPLDAPREARDEKKEVERNEQLIAKLQRRLQGLRG